MKTIELKEKKSSEFNLSWKNQMLELLRNPLSEHGMSIEEVRKSIRVIDVLENANGYVDLEDADYEYLKQRVGMARWAIAHPFVIEFVDDVNNAASVVKKSDANKTA